jgi:hypothetical protein
MDRLRQIINSRELKDLFPEIEGDLTVRHLGTGVSINYRGISIFLNPMSFISMDEQIQRLGKMSDSPSFIYAYHKILKLYQRAKQTFLTTELEKPVYNFKLG